MTTHRQIEDAYPLTPMQEGMFLHCLHDGTPGLYVLQQAFAVEDLEPPFFRRAWQEVVRRHTVLRTGFTRTRAGEPIQVVGREATLQVTEEDWRGPGAEALETRFAEFLAADRETGFDLRRPPLFRLALFRVSERVHRVVWTCHHMIVDGWSIPRLLGEVLAVYRELSGGEPARLPSVRPFRDFVAWLLGLDRAAAEGDDPRAWHRRSLPACRSERLAGFCRQRGLTLNTLTRGAWALLLSRYGGVPRVVFGAVVAGRPPELVGSEQMVGPFLNTVPVCVDVPDAETVGGWLHRLQALQAEIDEHAHASLAEIGRWAGAPSGTPLFESILAFENVPGDRTFTEAGRGLRVERLGSRERNHLPLSMVVAETTDGLLLKVEVDGTRFERMGVLRMLAHVERLLEELTVDAERRVGEVPLLSPAERHQMLVEWGGRRRDARGAGCIHDRFEEQAGARPDAVAVSCGGAHVTYATLARRAQRLAGRLAAEGVGPEVRVGILLERSLELVTAILAVHLSGGSYVPLDPGSPQARLRLVVEDARPRVVLTETGLASRLAGSGPALLLVERETSAEPVPGVVERRAGPHHAAYHIYTSGSTGLPKGVTVAHANVCRLFDATAPWFGFGADDVWPLVHSCAFDFAVWELWGALAHGGRLVVVPFWVARDPEALADLLLREGVTVLNQTPSAFAALARAERLEAEELGALRWVVFGGEALEASHVAPWLARHGGRRPRLANMYGITETTVHCTFRPLAEGENRIFLGAPIPDLDIRLLDARLEPRPMGVAGEIHVGGAGLARGYLGDPARTALGFPPSAGGRRGERLYRSGDLARWTSSGELEFLGRRDQQVQIRGFRVEIGEVEAVINRAPQVAEGVVVARPDRLAGTRLVAWVRSTAAAPEEEAVRSFLAAHLPDYMVPSLIRFLDRLPRTANGKVDRRALQERALEGGRTRVKVRFEDPIEEVLAALWADVLGTEVGAGDDFFALGGHSLLAARLVARIDGSLGVRIPLRRFYETPGLEAQAALVRELLGHGEAASTPPVVPVPREGPLPLSFGQERLWILDRMEPGSTAYHVPVALRVRGPLAMDALRGALEEVVRRHEVLRTRYVRGDEEPAQEILNRPVLPLRVVDLSRRLADGERSRRLAALVSGTVRRPFDLTTDLPVRATVVRLGEEEHEVVLVLHHIACDGWSMRILVEEVTVLYAAARGGRASPLAELPVQYADYAVWQREWLRAERLERQLEWWKERLAGLPPRLELPTDRPRSGAEGRRAGQVSVVLPPEVGEALSAFARSHGATLFMTLLSAYEVLLGRFCGQSDFAVGTPVAGRLRPEVDELIGFFVNNLVFRASLAGDPRVRELAARVRDGAIDAYSHQEVPFERLVEELAPKRDPDRVPLLQAILELRNLPRGRLEVADLELTQRSVSGGSPRYELSVTAMETARGLACFAFYDVGLFDRTTVHRMLAHLRLLLVEMVASPERRISDLPRLSRAEGHQVAREWNDTAVAHGGGEETLADLVASRAAAQPEAVAVVAEAEEAPSTDGERPRRPLHLSQGELWRRAGRLARYLAARGVGVDSLVAVWAERSTEMLVALLGVLRSGAAYLPLDPDLPSVRRAQVLADAGASVVLAQGHVLAASDTGGVPDLPAGVTVSRIDRAVAEGGAAGPLPSVPAEAAAYVLYTSGSTGRPKGVVVPHRGIVNQLRWIQGEFDLGASDRVVQKTPYGFDVSVWEVFWPLWQGVCLVMARPGGHRDGVYLVDLLARERVTTLHFVPSMLRAFLDAPEVAAVGGGVRRVMSGGEVLPGDLAGRFFRRFPDTRLVNLYGPTEASVDVTRWRVAPGAPGEVPIGRPIGNLQAHVLDPDLRRVPIGVAGELVLGGTGLARGYRKRPARTAERFVPDPVGERPGERLYRTGDRARVRGDGAVDFLGRLDHQVKLRGFRIELGDVESVLREHPDVEQSVVVVHQRSVDDARLVAYWVPATGSPAAPGPEEMHRWLAERLPPYMVPADFVRLSSLPLTASGKVDRKALPEPEAGGDGAEAPPEGLSPRDAVEATIAEVWAELFQGRPFGRDDDFFALGGHSLLAIRAVARVRSRLEAKLSVRDLFANPTVAGLAELLRRRQGEAAVTPPPIEPRPPAEHAPLSYHQRRLWLADRLLAHRGGYLVVTVVLARGPLAVAPLEQGVAELARRHEILRTRFPERDGEPVQVVNAAPPASRLPVVDLGRLGAGRDQEVRRLARREERRVPDLEARPPWHLALLRLGQAEHAVLWVKHHLLSDAWSRGIFARELGALYRAFAAGLGSPLRELPVQYADFAVWQREWLQGAPLDRLLKHWLSEVEGLPELELPTDFPKPVKHRMDAALVRGEIEASSVEALRRLAGEDKGTLFIALQALLAVVFHHASGQERFALAVNVTGRSRPELDDVLGLFVNTVVFRAVLEGDPTFRDVLRRTRDTLVTAYAHQDLPFDLLVEALRPHRRTAAQPLSRVKIDMQPAAEPSLGPTEVELSSFGGIVPTKTHFDLTLYLTETAGAVRIDLHYRTDLFAQGSMQRLLADLRSVAHIASNEPSIRLGRLRELLDAAHREGEHDERRRAREAAGAKLSHLRRRARVAGGRGE